MIRTATLLIAAAVLATGVGQAHAITLELDTDDFRVVDPSSKWMKKYGGGMSAKQKRKLNKLGADARANRLAAIQSGVGQKIAAWQQKQAAKPLFVQSGTGLTMKGSKKRSKGAKFFVGADELVNVKYTTSFSVNSKRANGAVGFVFGMTGQNTSDVNYYMLQWQNNGLNQGVQLLHVDGVHNGQKRLAKSDLITGGDRVTVLDSNDSVGGYATDGTVNNVMISYLTDSISISINGDDVLSASGDFEAGAFGYYAFGQRGVTWDPFPPTIENIGGMSDAEFLALVQNDPSGPPIGGAVPAPAALPAGIAMLLLAASRRKRRGA